MPGTMTRWEPFAELGELRTRFDRLLDDWMDGRERVWSPAIDVVRKDHHMILRGDIPGDKPEEVKIEVEDDILTVSGEHMEQEEHEQAAGGLDHSDRRLTRSLRTGHALGTGGGRSRSTWRTTRRNYRGRREVGSRESRRWRADPVSSSAGRISISGPTD